MEREGKNLHTHGNAVCSCVWEEAEEDVLVAGDDGSAMGFTVLLCTASWGDGWSTTATHWGD